MIYARPKTPTAEARPRTNSTEGVSYERGTLVRRNSAGPSGDVRLKTPTSKTPSAVGASPKAVGLSPTAVFGRETLLLVSPRSGRKMLLFAPPCRGLTVRDPCSKPP